MAINPTLARDEASQELFPLPNQGEAMVLKRDTIDFECTLPRGGKLWGRGSFFLTTKRIVFVAISKSCRQDFKSFEVPLETLKQPKFNQPIFGANYLSGATAPPPGDSASPLAGGDTRWSLTFNSGGCGTFLPLFYQLLYEMEERNQSAGGTVQQAADEGRLNQVAFVDPSDPSVLYLSQPTAAPNSQQTTAFDNSEPSAPPPEGGGDAGPRQGGQNQQCVLS